MTHVFYKLVIRLSLPLQKSNHYYWKVYSSKNGLPTVYPSVWQNKGCYSHFVINDGRIIWCQSSDFRAYNDDENYLKWKLWSWPAFVPNLCRNLGRLNRYWAILFAFRTMRFFLKGFYWQIEICLLNPFKLVQNHISISNGDSSSLFCSKILKSASNLAIQNKKM